MSEVSSWDPADDANTAAPPNGWPEFMQPSAVNNSARAMMGAIRRWYDTVTASLAGINTAVASKVNRSGDAMTGSLQISASGSQLVVNKATGSQNSEIWGMTNNVGRWLLQLGGTGETGIGNAGSNFALHRYADNGAYLSQPFGITRSNGEAFFLSALTLNTASSLPQHATRKDYVDQRDTDTYNAAWANITGWAAGQDSSVYTNATNYALSLHNSQQSYIDGKYNLRTHGNTNSIIFRWDGSHIYGRIDEAVEQKLADTRNAYSIGFDPGGGGPIGWVFSGNDGSTWFYCNVDSVAPSDARVKLNITDSEIDALGLLNQVRLSQFDFKPDVVGWYHSVGKTPEERQQMMRDAQPAHVGIGFVAQQVQAIIPEAVSEAPQRGLSPDGPLPDDMLTISNQAFVPYLVRAVQQLKARVEALEGR